MNIKTIEDQFHYCVWLFLEDIYEKLLPEMKTGSVVKIYVNRNITLRKCNSPMNKDKVISFLISQKVIKQTKKPEIMGSGTPGQHGYQAYEVYSFRVLPAFRKKHNYFKLLFANNKQENVFKCCGLTLDLAKAEIQYKQGPVVNITRTNKEILFLIILLKSMGKVVQYQKIAAETKARNYRKNKGDDEIKRDVQFLRKDLADKVLLKTGMTHLEIKEMIVSVTNQGYKIVSS